jgi:general secretion pathway protein I
MEVVIALAILAFTLVALLTTQAASINNSTRARDLTIATLLARSKMIDLEQKLADEGFVTNEQTEDGDFGDEAHPEIKWSARIIPVEMTLDMLSSFCEGDDSESDSASSSDSAAGGGCAAMLGGFGAPFESMMSEIGNSVRVVALKVTWPVGEKYKESMEVRALVTREDFGL